MGEQVVVVGVDGSPASYTALRWALGYVGRTGGRLRAVRCFRPVAVPAWEAAVTGEPVPPSPSSGCAPNVSSIRSSPPLCCGLGTLLRCGAGLCAGQLVRARRPSPGSRAAGRGQSWPPAAGPPAARIGQRVLHPARVVPGGGHFHRRSGCVGIFRIHRCLGVVGDTASTCGNAPIRRTKSYSDEHLCVSLGAGDRGCRAGRL